MIIYDNTTNTDGSNYFSFVAYDDSSTELGYSNSFASYDDSIKEDLYFKQLDREWRAYLKALWIDVLRIKICVPVYLGVKPLCHQRMLIPISGWLAKAGYLKKN